MGYFVALSFLAIMLLSSCSGRHDADRTGGDTSIQNGKRIAGIYCQTCHQLPDPSLLDKKSWVEGVLPAMGPRLGIFAFRGKPYPTSINDPYIGRMFYPAKPLIDTDQWQDILRYYGEAAPDSLLPPTHEPVTEGLSFFSAETPSTGQGRAPATTLVKIDTAGGRRRIIVGGLSPGGLRSYDARLKQIDTVTVYGAPVDWQDRGKDGVFCNIGELNPNNGLYGSVSAFDYDAAGHLRVQGQPFLRGLARPVGVLPADLNQDSLTDYLICEFGNLRGALSWMENKGHGQFVRHTLREQPGAIKAYIRDANGDGLPDIWVLFAQGDEGIFLYLNKGGGQFEEQRLLRFPPVYGSSYFELADVDGDGHPDIVYTCGDNADFSPVLKPYHGVYVFLNDGHNHFTQRFFYHLDGCYKAIARDFDGDGKVDLATISFFADYRHHPEDGFVYLANQGGWNFKPYTLAATQAGRWLTMDAGDVDGDGRPDLVLGNFSVAPAPNKGTVNWKKGPAFLVLKNHRK